MKDTLHSSPKETFKRDIHDKGFLSSTATLEFLCLSFEAIGYGDFEGR